jgi:cytidylate kinase
MGRAARSPLVVAIDGPAGSGKSTVAKALARRLSRVLGKPWAYLDSGAMYRAVTARALDLDVDPKNARRVAALARRARLRLDPATGTVAIDGFDVTEEIRSKRVDAAVSDVAKHGAVRAVMVVHQRRFARENERVVADGRDMGTVVFPKACVKVFLGASLRERARRRYKQMRAKGMRVTLSEVGRGIEKRDRTDEGREVAPLIAAKDALRVDTDGRTPAQVGARILALVKSRVPPVAAR